jgi:glutathione S-transferase
LLEDNSYLLGARVGITDIAIFPFIRQFAFVDKDWFDQAPYPRLQQWLQSFLESELFISAMRKQPLWQEGNRALLFP